MDLLRRRLLGLSGALLALGLALVVGALAGIEVNPFVASPEPPEATLLAGVLLLALGLFLLPPGRRARRTPQDEDEVEEGAGW